MEKVVRQQRSEMSLEQESVQDNQGSREVVGEREQEIGEIACNIENIVDKMGKGSKDNKNGWFDSKEKLQIKISKMK